jgi:UDP-GlcNAc:undecaprenyl-phosphate/decaprenyl-phosphate GlcNAc-1-phosphate transferase
MYDILLSFITAFIPCYFIIPTLIYVAKEKHLFDSPNERSSHLEVTPSLGGIAIFAGAVFSILYWTPSSQFDELQYLLCSLLIILLIGVKDDIMPMPPTKKLIGEILATCIIVFKSNVRITSLYGISGIHEIPIWFSILLSVFTIIVIINSFNLIDGINGLSGSISMVINLILGIWFFLVDKHSFAILSFSLAGAVAAFLRYNVTPARIFMGDTGSLLLGFVNSFLIIKFIEIHKEIPNHPYAFKSVPALAIGIMILPLFDTLRVFTLRILKGRSPFSPDRMHIHHMLVDLGLSHMQATSILVFATIFFTLFAVILQSLGNLYLMILILLLAATFSGLLHFFSKRKLNQVNQIR